MPTDEGYGESHIPGQDPPVGPETRFAIPLIRPSLMRSHPSSPLRGEGKGGVTPALSHCPTPHPDMHRVDLVLQAEALLAHDLLPFHRSIDRLDVRLGRWMARLIS